MKRHRKKASELLDLFLSRFGEPPPQALEESRKRLTERFNFDIEWDLVRTAPRRNTSWRWVAVGMAVMLVAAISTYRQKGTDAEVLVVPTIDASANTNADVLLMDAVSTHLSRRIPAPMEPIMALIPTQKKAVQSGETQ
jgi:hypothetical protein